MRPKAVVLSLDPDTREMEELVWSLGYDVAEVIVQKRDKPDPATFLGRGKLDEAADRAHALGASLVIVNAALKPGQIFALERHFRDAERRRARRAKLAEREHEQDDEDAFVPLDLGVDPDRVLGDGPGADAANARAAGARGASASAARGGATEEKSLQVYDRLRVILDIFSERARSPEARLQVEYARLQYETPLVKEVIHLAKKGEHPGFLGGGRYEVNYYYMMMRSRMARIRRELERMGKERDVRRRHRRRGGFRLVSLAGYTNAGKSSLLEALATHDVRGGDGTPFVVENRYFSTLATTTRRAERDGFSFLLTDTVGFIEDLPPWMVEAFHSTLEEIAFADCILLVVDASEPLPEMERKVRSSLAVLGTVHARVRDGARATDAAREAARAVERAPGRLEAPLVLVLNKADLLTPDEGEEKRDLLVEHGLVPEGARVVFASARAREGLDDVFDAVEAALPPSAELDARLPEGPATEAVLGWLRGQGRVRIERGEDVHVVAWVDERVRDEATRRLAEAGARLTRTP